MKTKFSKLLLVLILGVASSQAAVAASPKPDQNPPQSPQPTDNHPTQEAIIIDHNCTDLSKIPDSWLEKAKQLNFHYAHTSHGSQINSGLSALYQQDSKYAYQELSAMSYSPSEAVSQCSAGRLCFYDGQPGYNNQSSEDYITPDLYWDSDDGRARTRVVADTGLYNYSMWSWCGQQSDNSVETVQNYLNTMAGFETSYPNMRFILMTGHSDGGDSDLTRNNNMVRQFAQDHNMVVYDFEDIESYDPAGNYYDNDGEGYCEWCQAWCDAHPADCQYLPGDCAHSHPFACVQKAKAYWWMLARLAGWTGTSAPPPAEINCRVYLPVVSR